MKKETQRSHTKVLMEALKRSLVRSGYKEMWEIRVTEVEMVPTEVPESQVFS